MEIGGGITIGPGIRITASSAIRAALSAAGQEAYDAATAGNFIRVSAADYNNVRTTLSNTKTIGDNAAAILHYNPSGYSGTCAALNNPANSNVDPGFYIVGFVARHSSTSNVVFRYLTSTSDRGTYTQLANSALVANSNTASYYIRKDPTDVSLSTIYVGIVSNAGFMLMSNTNWSNAAFDCSEPFSGWSSRTGTQPVFQTLLTGDRQW